MAARKKPTEAQLKEQLWAMVQKVDFEDRNIDDLVCLDEYAAFLLAGCEDIRDAKWAWSGMPNHEHAVCSTFEPNRPATCVVDGLKYDCLSDFRDLRVACAPRVPK